MDVLKDDISETIKNNFSNVDVAGLAYCIGSIDLTPLKISKKEDFEKKVKKENQLVTKGIEVGHIFYFGDKYSKPMNASVDFKGKKEYVKMGSYGVGVSRLVLSLIHI